MTQRGTLIAISLSDRRGIPKTNTSVAQLVTDWGIDGDAHAGHWHRQVSLLSIASINKMRALGAKVEPGAFAENLTIADLDVPALQIGAHIAIRDALLEVTQIGKECHAHCAIYEQVGDCVMPREGVFARVLKGGEIHVGDAVLLSTQKSEETPEEGTATCSTTP